MLVIYLFLSSIYTKKKCEVQEVHKYLESARLLMLQHAVAEFQQTLSNDTCKIFGNN